MINRVAIIAVVAVALIGAAWFGIARWEADIRKDVREEIAAEQLTDDLAEAEKNLELERELRADDQAALATANAAISDMAGKVRDSHVTIQERVISGELPNGQIAPVPAAAVDEVQRLRAEVLAEDK